MNRPPKQPAFRYGPPTGDSPIRLSRAAWRRGDELITNALGELVDSASGAVATLRALLEAPDERVKLGAAKTILDQLLRIRETLTLSQRLATLERALQAGNGKRR